jgi:hypothetical protein
VLRPERGGRARRGQVPKASDGASVDAAAGAGGTIGVVYASIDFEHGQGETIFATMLAPDLSPAAPATTCRRTAGRDA